MKELQTILKTARGCVWINGREPSGSNARPIDRTIVIRITERDRRKMLRAVTSAMGIGDTVPFRWSGMPVPPPPLRPKPWLEWIPAAIGIIAFPLIVLLAWWMGP